MMKEAFAENKDKIREASEELQKASTTTSETRIAF